MSSLNNWSPRVLSLFRILIGLFYLEHGTSKLFGFPHVAAFAHLPPLILAAGIIETVGSILLKGLCTCFRGNQHMVVMAGLDPWAFSPRT
jgi:uncharacterized membrane protein YphA (DoxX/SURF4 family)